MLNKFKRFLSLLCAIVILIGTYGAYLIPLQSIVNAVENDVLDLDDDVKYFGRTFYEYDAYGKKVYKFSWANSGFQFSFKGKSATFTLLGYRYTKDNPEVPSTRDPYVKVYINGELATQYNISGATLDENGRIRVNPENAENTITVSNLKEGNYTIKVVKCTDGYYNGVGLSKIQLNNVGDIEGKILTTQKYYDRQILVIGDTLVSGYGTLAESQISNTTVYSTQQHEDSTLSFTALAADAFGAENMTVALQKRGIVKNSGGSTTHLAKDYFEYLDFFENFNKRSEQYDHTKYNPDVVVISFGLHDAASSVSAAEFKPACKDFIMQVKSAYPDAKILYTYGCFDDDASNSIASAVKEVISDLNLNGYDEIFYVPLTVCTAAEKGYQLSESYYTPTKEAHAVRADELILAIEDITDWKSSRSASVPVSDDMPADTPYRPFEDTDVSLMSFNVMRANVSGQIYLDKNKRAPLEIEMLKAYMPDVICLQEVSNMTDYQLTLNGVTITWADYFKGELEKVGYDCLLISDTTGTNMRHNLDAAEPVADDDATNRKNGGVMILWKANRFTKISSGRTRFVGTYGNAISNERWWQWVQLQDKQNLGTSFYVYNTDIYSKDNNDTQEQADYMSDKMLEALSKDISQKGNVPVIMGGDFEKYYNANISKTSLKHLYNIDFLESASLSAKYTQMLDPNGTPNHIFYNKKYIDMIEIHELQEGVEGRRLSSQEALIAHFNFRCPVTFEGGTFSEDKSVFTVETSGSKYNLNFTIGAGVMAKVWYDDLSRGSAYVDNRAGSEPKANISLTLENKKVTHFTLRLNTSNLSNDQRVNVVDIYVIRTDIQKPTVSATNTVNNYFANGAYHLLVSNHIIRVSAAGGDLYLNPYATRPVNNFTMNLKQGRTVLYVKSAATGDVYPVYIYRQTHTQAIDKASTSTIYVDDDFPTVKTGNKFAFYDGERVIFIDSARAFNTVAEAANAANGDGKLTTIYFGSGDYTVNNNFGDTIVEFTEDTILLGSNYDISGVDAQANQWYAAGRKTESVIHGGFYFKNYSEDKDAKALCVTVKGFRFEGESAYGAVCVAEALPNNTPSVMEHKQILDIQNNIFVNSIDPDTTGARSIILANSGAKVTGIVKDNYFKCVQNNHATGDYTRALCFTYMQDMLIEHNFFGGYEIAFYFRDVTSGSRLLANTSFEVYANRFELCGTTSNYLQGVDADHTAYMAYRNNDFVRCGAGGTTVKRMIDLFFRDVSIGKHFKNITVDIIGNRFIECAKAVRLFQDNELTVPQYAVTDMTFNLNKNSIVNTLEHNYGDGYFFSVDFSYLSTGTKEVDENTWDFSGNYCYSPFFDDSSDYYEEKHATNYAAGKKDPYDLRTYIHYGSGATALSDEVFKANIHAYTTAAEAFKGAVGSYEDGWIYDFDHIPLPDTYDKSAKIGYEYDDISDIADMDFLRGATPLSDKMTALDLLAAETSPYDELKKTAYHSMLTTEHLTGEMRGQTSFYSDVRWYCKNRVSFDIRTTYTGDEATFFYKYSNGAMPTGDTYANISNEMFYTINSDGRSSSVNGILLKFKTVNEVATIEMHVSGKSGWQEVSFAGIVDDLTEFIHIDIIEKEIGTMDFYVDGIHFARVIGTADDEYSFESGSIANTTNTADNAYYDTVNVYRVTNDVISTTADATVNNSLVAKQTAIAFSSAHTAAADTADELWPTKLSMEIDVLEVVDLGVGRLTIINHVAENILYKAWNITDCHYDEETKTYTYTVNEAWEDFFAPQEGSPYEKYKETVAAVFAISEDSAGKLVLTRDFEEGSGKEHPIEHDHEASIALSKAAVAYALEKGIAPIGVAKSKIKGYDPNIPGRMLYEAVIKPIDGPGYYVVNSTLGSLITTDTYDNKDGTYNLTVYDKNDPPMIQKFVYEDYQGNAGWKPANDASIGETVQFKLLVTVQDGAYGYTIHDNYGAHFENVEITSVKQYSNIEAYNNGAQPVRTYESGVDYVFTDNNPASGKFILKFASSSDGDNDVGSLEAVPSYSVIVVIYTAMVNNSVKQGEPISTSATLSYGRIDTDENLPEELRVTKQFETEEAIVNTYLWSLNLYKYAEVGVEKVGLQGAKFELYTDYACTNKLKFIGSKGNYRVATDETDYSVALVTTLDADAFGRYTIDGLDSGSYYLVEKEAPDGYAKMAGPELILIEPIYSSEVTVNISQYDDYVVDNETFRAIGIINVAGTILPSTGEAGRKLFIATGSVLVLSMGILLVTRMRSTKIIFTKTEVTFKK